VGGLEFSKTGRWSHFGVVRGAIGIDLLVGGSIRCLLWGEPGPLSGWGLFGWCFWELLLGLCSGAERVWGSSV
jgi:hypothetical protein